MQFREIGISANGAKWKIYLRDTDESENFLVCRSESYFSVSRWSPRFYLLLRRDSNRKPRNAFPVVSRTFGDFSALRIFGASRAYLQVTNRPVNYFVIRWHWQLPAQRTDLSKRKILFLAFFELVIFRPGNYRSRCDALAWSVSPSWL